MALLKGAVVGIRAVIFGQRDGRTNSLSPSQLFDRIEAVGDVGHIGFTILVGGRSRTR